MSKSLVDALSSIRIERNRWEFFDVRINIPAASFGSDAINRHTQYSNPVAIMKCGEFEAIGASFTLGEGNQMICEAADYIVQQFDGISVMDLIKSDEGFYESISNPLQLRWLSPNSGLPLMAGGLIVNTLIDAASKTCGLPAWEYLSKLPSDFLLDLLQLRNLKSGYKIGIKKILDQGLIDIDERCIYLRNKEIPVYYTTWIGHDAVSIIKQIQEQHLVRGIKIFKLKISKNIDNDLIKIKTIINFFPKDFIFCVDANQTLDFDQATKWMLNLSKLGVLWLEEPFAPDNIQLFEELVRFKRRRSLSCEIVTGENCPNHYTAAALTEIGIDRFQSDPCRMLGLIDAVLTSCITRINGCHVTPHAGGSSLDEQSPHIQLFNLARIHPNQNVTDTLTENVGFCSKYFASPTIVSNGMAKTPSTPGLLVGFDSNIRSAFKNYKNGITWLEL